MTNPDRIAAPAPSETHLRGATLAEVTAALQRMGEKAFRARQLYEWVFQHGVRHYDEMTNLPKALRARLADEASLGGLELSETVGGGNETQKLVFRTRDDQWVEAVVMRGTDVAEETDEPNGSTAPGRKVSVCVSSQIGCPLRCAFCLTGRHGFVRDLGADEIVDQLLWVRRLLAEDERLAQVVFMGMGEPLLNPDGVLRAVDLITSPQALGVSTRRVIVSTAGVIEGIDRLGREGPDVGLAVSLNATTQEVRDRLMPGCRGWPLIDLLEACRRYPLANRRRITFEYVLLRGHNDLPADGNRLVRFAHGLRCKVNLIVYNADDSLPFAPTPEAEAEMFRDGLLARGVTCSLRRSKGVSCKAACGQLAAHSRRRRESGGGRR